MNTPIPRTGILNHTPVWKSLLIFLSVAFFALYATPNLYGEDPAVQISAERTAPVDANLIDKVQQLLAENNITAKSVALENQKILVRLTDNNTQLKTQEVLEIGLGGDYIAAINLASATPD